MRGSGRFVLLLVVGLGLLTWLGYGVVTRTTRRWFENDVELRASLAAGSGRTAILDRWIRSDRPGVAAVLTEIARDKHITAVALCAESGERIAATDSFPASPSCVDVARAEPAHPPDAPWFFRSTQQGGPVHVSVVPLLRADGQRGLLVLLHDLDWVERREADASALVLVAFLVLALGASAVTLVAVRISWRQWTQGLRRMLRGDDRGHEFQPLMQDVRDLVQRLSAEREADQVVGRWTAERLKDVLERQLEGDRVVVLANREPYVHERTPEGIRVQHPASGLVTALEPVMRACSGVWVAHGSGSADRETVDANAHVRVPPSEESYLLRRVWLTEDEERGYYYGLANEGLWPLCHVAHTKPKFRQDDWAHYVAVNEEFARAACEEAQSDDPIVLVQDYHFALAPRMIRERLPRATILTFWHIPWPNAERFGIAPWRNEILEGLLGSSILGFHTQQHCNNFLDAVDTFLESRIDRERQCVVQGQRSTLVRPYPISIEWPVRWLADLPSAADCRREVFEQLGLPADALLGIGIDRLDYTKGIEERLLAVERLLERRPELVGRFVFAQLAAPSRTRIATYARVNDVLEETATRINARFGKKGYQPIALLRAHHEPPTVYRYYRAADVCYVSSLHDGMNLVAKEFVAAREDLRGVLLLSRFTGAARELTEALVVNPYDLEESSAALEAALHMPVEEQADRMRAMRALVSEFNVYRWAGKMLIEAATVRRKERLVERLAASPTSQRGAAA